MNPPRRPDASGEGGIFGELARRLEERDPRRIPRQAAAAHAAVALLLAGPSLSERARPVVEVSAPSGAGAGGAAGPTGGPDGIDPPDEPDPAASWGSVRALLILRRQVEGDPWAGHVALPGGKREAGDADLVDTARRETAEETGLEVSRSDVLGGLSDIHPRSVHLPDLAIRPYVARWSGGGRLRLNEEVDDAFWVPLATLADPGRRSELVLERRSGRRRFPTIELGGHTVWGLTHAILEDFLALIRAAGGAEE